MNKFVRSNYWLIILAGLTFAGFIMTKVLLGSAFDWNYLQLLACIFLVLAATKNKPILCWVSFLLSLWSVVSLVGYFNPSFLSVGERASVVSELPLEFATSILLAFSSIVRGRHDQTSDSHSSSISLDSTAKVARVLALQLGALFALFLVSEYHSLKTSYVIVGVSVGFELSRYIAALGAFLIANAIGARLFIVKFTALNPYIGGSMATVTAGTITSFFTVALLIEMPVSDLSGWVNFVWDYHKLFWVYVILAIPIVILVLLMTSSRSRIPS